MDGTCSARREVRNENTTFVEKTRSKRTFGKPRRVWEGDINWILQK
jgi:hypothetical protein